MGEIRFAGTGETRGYPYPVCRKLFYTTLISIDLAQCEIFRAEVSVFLTGETRGYPYPVCKKTILYHSY